MSQKRTYLDSLNAGRRRRQSTSLERLNRTLETLENRVGGVHPNDRDPDWEPPRRQREHPRREQPRREREASWREHQDADPRRAPAYHHLASDLQRARSHEQEFASVSQIAGELQSLREELRHQMGTGIGREFAALRRDIERAAQSGATNNTAAELSADLERLSDMIERLAERGDDKGVNMLRLEIEQVKSALGDLAREDTVRSVGMRWEEFDQRWNTLAEDLRAARPGQGSESAYEAVQARLAQIESAVQALPESLSLRTLEEKLRMLASVVDDLNRQQDRLGPEALEVIERRLDELSRAVVASTSAQHGQQIDPEPLERIEARIGMLARQIEELSGSSSGHAIADYIQLISERVDELSHRVELPENAVERLAQQIALISDKLDTVPSAPDLEPVFRDMEDRFAAISSKLEQRHGDALEQGHALFRELEQRIEAIAAQGGSPGDVSHNTELMQAMERRFAEFVERFEQSSKGSDGATVHILENRLEEIANRLQASSAASSFDPELIRSLQDQVSSLSEHMMRPEKPLPEFEDLGPRLDYIERSIVETREKLMDAARQAAEDAVRSLSENHDAAFASELGNELRSLENLTRTSDERNAKTFEAIHDTLIKIVDRLGSIEKRNGSAASVVDAPAQRDMITTPSIAPEFTLAPAEDHGDSSARDAVSSRSAAEAASEAARAAAEETDTPASQPSRSILGGITRALKSRKKNGEDTKSEPARTEPAGGIDFDQPLDPKLANQPLEPGSGAPDLNAIMRRVRDQRDGSGAQDSVAAKSDFIAAARRAAQAAAAEAEATKGRPAGKASAGSGLARFLPGGRKTMLLGLTAMVVIMGSLQLSRNFMSNGPEAAAPQVPNTVETENFDNRDQTSTMPSNRDELEMVAVESEPEQTAKTPPMVEEARPVLLAYSDPKPAAFGDHDIASSNDGFVGAAENVSLAAGEDMPEPLVAVPHEAGPVALREAAETGNPAALFEIGNRYAEGRGVETDMEKAAEWYEMSAEMGLASAQYRIGNLYEKGIGVDRDLSLAMTWYQLAAAQGNASAMHNLAVLFAMGPGGVTDNDSAARWFLEAAELGVTDSQFNMGVLAAKGIGMPQNLEEGYKWFAIVAETGDNDAKAKRDEVAGLLSPEGLERAQAAADLWRVRTPDPESNIVTIPDEWTESPATTTSVSMRDVLADLQRVLNTKGYDAGPVDGLMGQKTRAAIIAFQRDNGLDATGEIDQALVQSLLQSL